MTLVRRSVQSAASVLIHRAILFAVIAGFSTLGASARPNVLLLLVDDLRPQLGCYGDAVVKSPHIDQFAREALLFRHAYVQQAVCSPSRNSFLSGLRPETTGLRGFGTTLRGKVPDVVTLPQHFKNHGYESAGIGKVFHFYVETGLGSEDDAQSWSRPLKLPTRPVYGPAEEARKARLVAAARERGVVFNHPHDIPRPNAWDAPDVADDALQDAEIATEAIAFLREPHPEPFFLAVGFLKPHLPFVAPKRYWDLYPAAAIQLPKNQHPPANAPSYVTPTWGDLRRYANIPDEGPLDETAKRSLLHGYLACVSYVDAQIGRVLAELKRLGLDRNTVIVLTGDHGMQVGEHGSWTDKHSTFETSTRVPLLVATPDAAGRGATTDAFAELVDLYPTLAELCGLPAPGRSEGLSFAPLLSNPALPWKTAAFSEMPRGGRLGRSMRTTDWRVTEWTAKGKPTEYELYDHRTDPGENVNLADRPGHAEILSSLQRRLGEGWRGARP